MSSPIEYRLKIDLDPGQKLTLDPPLKINHGSRDYELTGLEPGLYNTGTMALQIYCKDNEFGLGSVPFSRLTICIPGMKLSSPGHFFVEDPSIAEAFISAGIIEPFVPPTDGRKFCIHCKQSYNPKYASLQEAQAKEERGSIYAEQHITGICSDECWDAVTKPDDY